MQSSFFQNENRHRLIEYDLYESCLKRQLFYTKWCWAVIASALSGQNERSCVRDIGGDDAGQLACRGIQDG